MILRCLAIKNPQQVHATAQIGSIEVQRFARSQGLLLQNAPGHVQKLNLYCCAGGIGQTNVELVLNGIGVDLNLGDFRAGNGSGF